MGWAKNSIPPEQAGNPIIIFQTALTQKDHHNFHTFRVIFQPHSVKIYFCFTGKLRFLAVLDR
jgi:hypothetical protein